MELVFGLLHGDMIRPLGIGTLIGGALIDEWQLFLQ